MNELEKDLETFDDILLEKLYDVCCILSNIISYMNTTDKFTKQQLKLNEIIKELSALRKEKKNGQRIFITKRNNGNK